MKFRPATLSNLLIILWPLCAMAAQRSEDVALPAVESVQQQLISAAKAGDSERIRTLLAQGALLYEKDNCGYTPFEWAAIYGHVACLHTFLDELESNPPPDSKDDSSYYATLQTMKRCNVEFDIFKREGKSTELSELARCILTMYDSGREWVDNIPGRRKIHSKVFWRLQTQLSLNVVLTCFSSGNEVLQQALLSAGAIRASDNPYQAIKAFINNPQDDYCHSREYRQALLYVGARPAQNGMGLNWYSEETIKERHFHTLMRFAIAEEHEDLLTALIATKPDLTKTYSDESSSPAIETPLIDFAGELGKTRMAKLLLDAGAPVNQRPWYSKVTPFNNACHKKLIDMAQLFFEAGARIEDTDNIQKGLMSLFLGKHSYCKMLLQGSIRRYAPSKKEAKIAMQHIAQLIYGLSTQFPAHAIYEILLFATGEMKDREGNTIAPDWTKALRNSLAVLYLYKRNGNKLYPLWEQTIRCMIKDPEQQTRFISKLEDYIRPFLGNEVVGLACAHLMQRIAEDAGEVLQSEYENDFFGKDFGLYRDHMAQGPLKIDELGEII